MKRGPGTECSLCHGYFNENINTFLSAVTWTTIRQFANRCVSVEFPHHVWLTAGLSGSLLCCQVSWWSTGSPPLHTDYTVLNWKSQSCSEDLELWWCLQWSVKREVIITAQSGFQWLDVCPLLYWPCIKCSLPGPVGGWTGGTGDCENSHLVTDWGRLFDCWLLMMGFSHMNTAS